MKLDLSILHTDPEYSQSALLSIEALTPLSMVAKMPGKYFRSQPAPTDSMLLAMLENALGWHLSDRERYAVIASLVNEAFSWPDKTSARNKLKERLKQQWAANHDSLIMESGVEFVSLLQFHVRVEVRSLPNVMHFDDLWSQHVHGPRFPTGSRNYDAEIIPLMNLRNKKIKSKSGAGKMVNALTFADKKTPENTNLDKIHNFQEYDEIHLSVIEPFFPQYYVSPKLREYVWPHDNYKFVMRTSPAFSQLLAEALDDPAAPLHLGSNDGWVNVTWEVLP